MFRIILYTSWYNSWWLVVDANFESCLTPIHKLDGPLGLNGGDGSVDILWHYISSIQHAAGHVLAVTGVAFHHLVGGFEAGVGDLSYRKLLMVSFFGRDYRGIGDQREVNTGVRHQISLELSQIHVKSTIKTQRSSDGADNLANQSVKVGISRTLNVQVSSTDVVDCLIVHHKGTVRVFQCGMGC